ncbi:hypothetical protein PMAYCL1PPCAC_09081, partial [Pristionchus mayeri]
SFTIAIIVMLVQLVRKVKEANNWASSATKRYQRLAVRSLVLQGSLPTLVYFIPMFGNTFIQVAPALFEVGERFNRFGLFLFIFLKDSTILSPILWIFLTKHTFASSLVILYCSPSYRKKLASISIPY